MNVVSFRVGFAAARGGKGGPRGRGHSRGRGRDKDEKECLPVTKLKDEKDIYACFL